MIAKEGSIKNCKFTDLRGRDLVLGSEGNAWGVELCIILMSCVDIQHFVRYCM